MSFEEQLAAALKDVVSDLVAARLDALRSKGVLGRLDIAQVMWALAHYGRTLVDPPAQAFAEIEPIEFGTGPNRTWRVDFDLWTKEEGQSDLTLSLLLHEIDADLRPEIIDIRVM